MNYKVNINKSKNNYAIAILYNRRRSNDGY